MTSLMPNRASSVDASGGDKPLGQKWIDLLFTRLTAQLGMKMADLYQGVDKDVLKREWSTGLAGFAGVEIERGLLATARCTFAPTLGEFAVLCRPSLDAEVAWMEAVEGCRSRDAGSKGDWSHPAVYWASVKLAYELRNKSFKDCRRSWEYALQREFAKGWVADVPEPALRLMYSTARVRPPTAAEKEALAALRNSVHVKPSSVDAETSTADARGAA